MKKNVVLIGVFVTGISLYLGWYVFTQNQEAAMMSCISSLESPVSAAVPAGGGDHLLSSEVSEHLLSDLVNAGKTDCGRIQKVRNGTDIWGNPIRIYVYKSRVDERARVRVTSNGHDGLESTDDDIIVESAK
jgi:hypothetical protein